MGKDKNDHIGADIALFDNRINLTFDYYLKNSSDLLARDAIDPTTGFSSLTKNVGEMQNNGVEFSVNADIIKNRISSGIRFSISVIIKIKLKHIM